MTIVRRTQTPEIERISPWDSYTPRVEDNLIHKKMLRILIKIFSRIKFKEYLKILTISKVFGLN